MRNSGIPCHGRVNNLKAKTASDRGVSRTVSGHGSEVCPRHSRIEERSQRRVAAWQPGEVTQLLCAVMLFLLLVVAMITNSPFAPMLFMAFVIVCYKVFGISAKPLT